MKDHESIRAQLALAAAGGLEQEELRQIEQHARECESCRRELEVWGLYASGLRQLPQPEFPPDLLARTQAAVLLGREQAIERKRNGWMFCALAAYSWATSIAVWIVARTITGGSLEILGTNLLSAGPWFLISFALSWFTAGVAAVTLGSRHQIRRVYESIQ